MPVIWRGTLRRARYLEGTLRRARAPQLLASAGTTERAPPAQLTGLTGGLRHRLIYGVPPGLADIRRVYTALDLVLQPEPPLGGTLCVELA